MMARFSVYKMYMPMHDKKWWSCGEASRNAVSLIGGQSVSVNLAALVFFAIALPVAGTGVSCYSVTTVGASCEFVASSSSVLVELG